MKNKNCIVVPLHKEFADLTSEELLSLTQLFKVLGIYPIYFIGPSFLNWNKYLEYAHSYAIEVFIKNFDSSFFKSIQSYNSLMLDTQFYKSLKQYRFMLVYQTDAYVFRNELDDWCGKGYDFIGAPWFKKKDATGFKNEFSGVGNGGFSLRNVSSSLRISRRMDFLKRLRSFWHKNHLHSFIRFESVIIHLRIFFKIKNSGSPYYALFDESVFEDYYWGQIIPSFFTDYKVATTTDAIKFSFEINSAFLFEANGHNLPFGCHAWSKYEPEFWRQYINNYIS